MFFSNIHSIFYDNVEETKQLMDEITGSHTYGGRVVSILNLLFHGRPNLILLETPPNASLMHYLTDALCLSVPENEILVAKDYATLSSRLAGTASGQTDALADRLRAHPAEWVDGFVTDSHLLDIAGRLGKRTLSTLAGSKNGNNKYLLYRHQLGQRLPVFDTLMAPNSVDLGAALTKLRSMGYRGAVVKAQIGASGYGMLKVAAEGSFASAIPEFFFFEGPCMVQGWIEDGILEMKKIASPSVQIFVDEDTVYLFDMTEQILSDESVHEGNMSPPPGVKEIPEVERELWRQGAIAATWLHSQGYRGTASADFLIVERQKRIDTILCEVNARVTGATYPALLARHFKPGGNWLMRNVGFRKAMVGSDLLALMNRAGVLFRRESHEGIIPFNFNTDMEGRVLKGQFVCIGNNLDECNKLLTLACSQLPVEWGYDRD